jgi:hypothetical protein
MENRMRSYFAQVLGFCASVVPSLVVAASGPWNAGHYEDMAVPPIQAIKAAQPQGQRSAAGLKGNIVAEIRNARMALQPSGDSAIDSIIADAATRYSAERHEEAASNAARLGRAIAAAARASGTDSVTDRIVIQGLRDLCPLWPFCS